MNKNQNETAVCFEQAIEGDRNCGHFNNTAKATKAVMNKQSSPAFAANKHNH